jgi:hypothetical protein
MYANRTRIACPDEEELELWVLTAIARDVHSSSLADHVTLCHRCLAIYAGLLDFYGILASELDKPMSASVVRFVKRLTQPATSPTRMR